MREGVGVTLPVDGQSMLPFIIGGKESVILQRPGLIDVGDVVLAWVENRRYVVHRIIQIDDDCVTLMGDGNLMGTEHCLLSDIKARVTHVVDAKERTHDINNRWRKLAAKMWFCIPLINSFIIS